MVGTPFLYVYKRAITELKDPDITNLFNNNDILFSQVMYNFLENAISLFTNPKNVVKRLEDRKSPYTISENFKGDGVSNIFHLSTSVVVEDLDLFVNTFLVNDEKMDGKIDFDTNSIIFDNVPPINSDIKITIYYSGSFEKTLYDQEIYILSQLILACWSEYIGNNKLDIERLLGDSDFSLSSNATTTTAKTSWNNVNREVATKRMNKFAWDAKIMRLYG